MKYTVETTINKPLAEVIRLFDSQENLFKWMEGLTSFEPISGTPGEVGAKSKMVFNVKNKTVELIETITRKDLPNSFDGTYETNGVYNIVKNKFIALPDNTTKYISDQEFQLSGLLKIFGFLMKGAFKKQSLKYLEDFKRFAESQ